MKAPKEGDLVAAVIEYLTLLGHFVWRQNQGGMTASYKGRSRFIRFANVKGISDVIGLLKGGRMIAVECKMKGNKPTTDQKAFLGRVAETGGLAVVAYSVNDVVNALKENDA